MYRLLGLLRLLPLLLLLGLLGLLPLLRLLPLLLLLGLLGLLRLLRLLRLLPLLGLLLLNREGADDRAIRDRRYCDAGGTRGSKPSPKIVRGCFCVRRSGNGNVAQMPEGTLPCGLGRELGG